MFVEAPESADEFRRVGESIDAWLKEHGSTVGSPVPAFDMTRLHELVGFPEIWAFEQRYVETKET